MADLLRAPVLGPFLRWRHARTSAQIPLLILSIVMVWHGLSGPSLAPKNLATTLSWIQFRGLLIFTLLCAGNFFCFACPFMLVRNAVRRFVRPRFNWPRALRNKWPSLGLFVLILFSYELFALWSSPRWTAWIIVGYFAAAVIIDALFKHASFCKFVCPIGQFNFVASLVSPLEVAVRDQKTCSACSTWDCIRGRRSAAPELVMIQRGCELALFQPRKTGNMDCTFCLECVQACPHDNVGILSRTPAIELVDDPMRSGIGRFSQRRDIAALAVVFTFGALLNAFGMITPVYALETWLAQVLGVRSLAPILALLFAVFLIAQPAILLGAAALLNRKFAGSRSILSLAVRYSYALVPLGFGMWLAHYGFHFLTGMLTIVPVTQNALASIGWPIFGEPMWLWTGMPKAFVQPLENGFLLLGLAGSLFVAHQLAGEDSPSSPQRIFLPWAAVCLLLWAGACWLIAQPMDMRGTFISG